jgi:hypothetical protein
MVFTSDAFDMQFNPTGAAWTVALTTTQVFRDPAAWYHLVIAVDTTQGTTSDRIKFYVNGSQVTSFSTATYPTASLNLPINLNQAHQICADGIGTGAFDGELAEVNFVDGYPTGVTSGTWAATNVATIFGAFSTYNQWLPIKYAGAYGTNGFYLPFNSVSTSSYAGSFNGSNQYLSMPLNAVLTLGSGNFTIEAWILKSTSGSGEVFGKTGTINYAIDCATIPGNYTNITLSSDGLTVTNISGSTALATNRWYHVAWVRSGTTINIYVNGVLDGTGTFSGAIFSGSNVDVSGIGARPGSGTVPDTFFNGSISNLRVVKGTAVYTANFTPSVVPLTAITNTSLLTLQSATIVDNSGNSVSITNNNTVVTSVQYPFTLAIAADSSGNGNNWTPNNISLTAGSTYDSLTDVPTLTSTTAANYAVYTPLATVVTGGGTALATLTNGNLTASSAAANFYDCFSSFNIPTTGKWYFEWSVTTVGTNHYLGIASRLSWTAASRFYQNNGDKIINGTSSAYGATYTSSDVIGCAIDMDVGTLVMYKNNTTQGTLASDLVSAAPATGWCVVAEMRGTAAHSVNFGQQPFVYTPPTGFLPLNTYNIPAGTVTTSGTFTGNLSTDGPMVWLNGTPTAMTINGNAVTFGTQADKLANGFKVRSSSASYNASGSNTYVATTVGAVFKYEDAQGNP